MERKSKIVAAFLIVLAFGAGAVLQLRTESKPESAAPVIVEAESSEVEPAPHVKPPAAVSGIAEGITLGAAAPAIETADQTQEDFTPSLRRYLNLQYRAEFYSREFDRDLDRLSAEKERSPEKDLDPLASASYAKLLELWPAIEHETHRLAAAYAEAAKVKRSASSAESARLTSAQKTLDQFDRWLASLTEADRLQAAALLLELRKVEGVDLRLPSWLGSSDYGALAKRHEKEIAAKARAAVQEPDEDRRRDRGRDDDRSGSRGEGADVRDGARARWSEDDFSEERKTGDKVYPSTGSAGNFIGNQLNEGVFVLTFDDGPGTSSTRRLHSVLTGHSDPVNPNGAPATFFALIEKAHQSPEVLEATRRLGFHINNHSWTHPNFAKISANELRRQIVDSTRELEKLLGGESFRFFRCPYGACFAPKIPAARELIAQQNLIHAYWTIDSLDWKHVGRPEKTAALVIKEMQVTKRGVILLHDIHASTVDATVLILDWIKSRNMEGAGLRLVSLEDAVDLVNGRSHEAPMLLPASLQ